MEKIKVVAKTTYIVEIESFDAICEPNMTIEESDEFIKAFLRDNLKAKADDILYVDTV